ncbi:gluconate:proton symporter [Raoultella ornithinolytica]|uniref:gluconate:proton symporter n=1 Tax=Raoultella ornithinolytica TaxID=54291 RepID=UPI001F42D069|nr:gluconate:proton symporter [Raoultella ornithinolytica]MCF1303791.1 gluconate:proton symporter [Raoultella ornithinolytica]HCT2143007.1 gluconate:proton symporter [Raoultella ornithinolytica]
MSDSTLSGNPLARQNITRKNIIIGLLLGLFLATAFWCHGHPADELGLLSFTPLVALAILSLVGVDIVLAVISSIIIAMIMTSTSLPEMGTMLAKSTGSFIATVGLIIMLGAGVGEVATRTGAAVELVKFVVHRIGLSSQTRVKLGIVISSILICGALGTMAGGNAIIVAVIIPVAAAVRLTPLMMTAGSIGLFTGPFTPSTVTILKLGGLSYPDYLLYVGLPMSAVTLLAGWVMAGRIQKMTEGKLRYEVDLSEKTQEQASAAVSRRKKLSALAFAATIIVMAVVGVVIKAGFSFAIIVMLLVALITGLVGGLRPTQILQALYHGCGRLVWMFILYWLYNPILELMDGLHAYQGLLDYTQPLLEGISPAWLCFCIFAFNIIGHVPGAAVAQMTFTHKIFGPMLMAAGVPPQGTTAVLLASSQVDWFGPFPSSDMFGQMGLAQSTHLKYMLYNGWAIVIANIILFALLFQVLV